MNKSNFVILIADNDDRTRQALTNSLRTAGYEVIAAANGQAALAHFHAAPTVNLVVLDVLSLS